MELGNAKKSKLGLCNQSDKYVRSDEVDINSESSHAKIINLVKDNSKVLDLGCSDGIIGKYLHRHKNCEVYGCDINEESLKIVRESKCYEKAFNADLDNSLDLDEYLEENYFDYIVIADVIEHLKNPNNIIMLADKYLNKNGVILICVPNISHENIIINLINDKFNYNNLGILDNTHLRFFTEKSFVDFVNNVNDSFENHSLKCELVDKVKAFDADDHKNNKELLDLIKTDNTDILQFVFKLTKTDEKIVNSYSSEVDNLELIDNKIRNLKNCLLEEIESCNSCNAQLMNRIKYLESEIANRDFTINELRDINNGYNFKIYKMATVIRKILLKLFPYGSIRRKIVHYIKKIVVKIIKFLIKIFKFLFKLFTTKNFRRKIAKKVKYHNNLSKIFGLVPYGSYQTEFIDIDNQVYPIQKVFELNKTIGVHLHLYYVDLSDEFVEYLTNFPYKFDLYISIPSGKYRNLVRRKFKKITNVNKVIVEVSNNSGRDFGPMFALFGSRLKNYDYILHIHSKKSLRTGSAQDDWRNYLLRTIVGSSSRIVNILSIMENYNVGVVYQDTHSCCPYWCHTWLGAAGIAKDFLNKLGMQFKDSYLNFSAGSMFFVKTESVKQLFELNLTWDDFGKEENKSDGTLAYVFERIFVLLAKHNKYDYAVYNGDMGKFLYNKSIKNIDNYDFLNIDNSFGILNNFPIVTFDIFDTLITRKIYCPDDLYTIMEEELLNDKIKLSESLIKLRKDAESIARTKLNKDVNIHEIYNEFANISKLDIDVVNKIKNMEIDLELELCIPRKEMLKLYNKLLQNNKQIVLISDMYLTKDIIEKMLKKCGYENYFDILISCEVNKRKDLGTMWDLFFEKYDKCNVIHVGDNEESDIHLLCDIGKNSFHIMQGRKLYELSDLYYDKKLNFDTNLARGLAVNNCLFNSPFVKKTINLYDFGYSILGPLFFEFSKWINKISKDYDEVLFFAREGYYLKKIYKNMYPDVNNAKYFLISRRAITVANIHDKKDIMNIFNTHYNGSLKKLFLYRLGIDLGDIEDTIIKCPEQNDFIEKLVDENIDKILTNAANERNNYLKYVEQTIDNIDGKILVVDLGYSGTSQYELSKLVDKKIDGAYFIVSDNLKPLSLGCNVYSCFNDIIYDNSFSQNPLGYYSLFLEAFLTSPDGQLSSFDENINPVFLYEANKEETVKLLDKIYNGIVDFINDYTEINNKSINSVIIDKEFAIHNFKRFVELKRFDNEMFKIFKVEDFYCGNNILDVISFNF